VNISKAPDWAGWQVHRRAVFAAGANRFCEIALLSRSRYTMNHSYRWTRRLSWAVVRRQGRWGSTQRGWSFTEDWEGRAKWRFRWWCQIRERRRWDRVDTAKLDVVTLLALLAAPGKKVSRLPTNWYEDNCYCPAYSFPHRRDGGSCCDDEAGECYYCRGHRETYDGKECDECGGTGWNRERRY
jgi:hypothetical protein